MKGEALVFISHDHRDQAIAKFLADAINEVSGGNVHTFYSSAAAAGPSGIPYGEEWFRKIQQKLRSASQIICILTPQSAERPWIYFEAGFARGVHREGFPIVALLVDVDREKVKTGVFAHFKYAIGDDTNLIDLLHQVASSFEPSENAINTAVEKFTKNVREYRKHSSIEVLRAYRACLLHSELTFGLMSYLDQVGSVSLDKITEWIQQRSNLAHLSEVRRNRLLFSLQTARLVTPGMTDIKLTENGIKVYHNVRDFEKDPHPFGDELKFYRELFSKMNFVPKILGQLFKHGVDGTASHDALKSLVRNEFASGELTNEQLNVAFERVLDTLKKGLVLKTPEQHTIQLTQRGEAMCRDLFSTLEM